MLLLITAGEKKKNRPQFRLKDKSDACKIIFLFQLYRLYRQTTYRPNLAYSMSHLLFWSYKMDFYNIQKEVSGKTMLISKFISHTQNITGSSTEVLAQYYPLAQLNREGCPGVLCLAMEVRII